MSMSAFSGLMIAKSGIRTARANLQITGQNMANVNTEGYTRQNVLSQSIGPTDGNTRLAGPNLQIGNGVDSYGVNQSRDPYLDIRYRQKNAVAGRTGAILDTLKDIDSKMDETVNKGISAQLSEYISKLQSYATTGTADLEETVKNSARILTNALNHTAKELSDIRSDTLNSLQNDAIKNANQLLQNIASLNEQIKSADISGSNALELRDQRNAMIDKLSKYANIEVSETQIAVGVSTVNTLQINLVSGDRKFNLVDDGKYNQFSLDTAGAKVNIQLKTTDTPPADVTWHDPSDNTDKKLTNADASLGEFGGYLTMLNDEGEFDNPDGTGTTTARGIGYYQKILDKLANTFADLMNKANSTDSAGTNKPLFQSSDGTAITASNIQLSTGWTNSSSSYLTAAKGDGTTGNNILYMVNQLSKDISFTTDANNSATNSSALFHTSISGFMSTVTNSVLALQAQDIDRQNTTATYELNNTETERQSVSAVDINEEGINLIQFNQALNASSRFMSTMNDVLDTIINKMGVL